MKGGISYKSSVNRTLHVLYLLIMNGGPMDLKQMIVRVYGFLLNDNGEILISDEFHYGMRMRKLPGGGLQLGEGTAQTLKRELMEEMEVDLLPSKLVHTTASFIRSVFNPAHQVMGVYYHVPVQDGNLISRFKLEQAAACKNGDVFFRWSRVGELNPLDFTFPMDQEAWMVFKGQYDSGLFT
jgi:8-oxo-dGTP diphosphatase